MNKYKVLRDYLDRDANLWRAGEEVYLFDKDDFKEALIEHGFVEKIKNDFDVVATSKLAGVEIAAEDYVEGDKKHFTWDEAMEAVEKLSNGWRLPTRKEWTLICEEFGCDEDGGLSGGLLAKNLNLEANGWKDSNGSLYDSGSYGDWWSSTANDTDTYYRLLCDISGGLYSGNSVNRYLGLSVRCVRDIKSKGEENE